MKHLDEIELMEHIAGNLTASRDSEVKEHLAMCEDCSKRRREAAETWRMLGQWNVDTAGHDVAEKITALAKSAGREQKQTEKAHRRVRFLPVVLRMAASIIIAVGVGHRLGKYSVTGEVEQVAGSKSRPEYLAAFGLEWSSDLAWLIMEDDYSNIGQDR
jgi:anti-sigma factor RsiW